MLTLKCITFHVEPSDGMIASKPSYFVFIRDYEINVFHWVQRLARINLRDNIRHQDTQHKETQHDGLNNDTNKHLSKRAYLQLKA